MRKILGIGFFIRRKVEYFADSAYLIVSASTENGDLSLQPVVALLSTQTPKYGLGYAIDLHVNLQFSNMRTHHVVPKPKASASC